MSFGRPPSVEPHFSNKSIHMKVTLSGVIFLLDSVLVVEQKF